MAIEAEKGTWIRDVQTICRNCHKPLNGNYARRDDAVFLESSCPDCGDFSVVASEYADDFIKWTAYNSISVPPKQALTRSAGACPLSCGTCEDHLMTACCVLLDVTSRCNQRCPWCFAVAGEADGSEDPTLDEIGRRLDRLLELGEERPFNIQLSGGEPTVRGDLPELVRMGRGKGFEYIQLNTNGRRLGQDAAYAAELAEAGLTTVFLQFDGVNDEICRVMRGEALLDLKKRAIENCARARLPVTLVPTVLRGVNLGNVGAMFEYMLDNLNVIKGMHFQPASFFGRHPDGESENAARVTMFELMREIERQTGGRIRREELVPISTGHPLCCFCGTFLAESDGSVTSLVSEEQKAEGASCCCSAEPDPLDIIKKDRDFVLNKWTVTSRGGAEQGASNLVDGERSEAGRGDAGRSEAESSFDAELDWLRSHMFTISGMAFMDVTNLDAERLKRCRVQYFTEDERLIPFCAYNSLYRK